MARKCSEKALPFTLRLTPSERSLLEYEAAGLPLGEFIRMRSLDQGRVTRRMRGKHPVKDHIALARILGKLGQMRVAANLNQLAKAANTEALTMSEQDRAVLMEACADIREIRDCLMAALGRRG